jgi:hypothetical protein
LVAAEGNETTWDEFMFLESQGGCELDDEVLKKRMDEFLSKD